MNVKHTILAGIIAFIALFIMDFAINGGILASIYQATASVWRPEAQMKQLWAFMVIGQVFFGFLFAIIYAYGYNPVKASVPQGLRYGLLMALLLAPANSLGWYAILPIPGILAVYWFISMVIELLVLGLLVGLVYKPR